MSVTSLELQIEREKNVFTQFYTPAYQPKQPKKKEVINEVQQALRDFKHKYALNFACTSLLIWRKFGYLDFPKLKRSSSQPVCQIPPTNNVFAFYRVISEFSDKYLLNACHVNVHGYHRGDLRFIEINNRTVTRGIPEGEHCLGRLFIGDIVAVTGMARMKNFEEYTIFDIKKDSDCTWMATNIIVLPRSSKTDATFSLLKNGTAVVKEHSEVMNVDSSKPLKIGKLYTGSAFLPEKMATNYCMDFQPDRKNELIYISSKIHQYPNALGTIFKFQEAPELTKMFEIGTDAFLYSSASEILETCVLMGYAAANSITNGRFDSRSFPMENIDRKGPIVKFQIDNPPDNPTEGKWTINSRIRISGPTGECNAIIETVILQKNRLSITSRLSREVPNREKFKEGLFIVYQREAPESQILRTGFFEKVPSRSNGRKILEVLYGADALENPKNQAIFQYFFPEKERKLKLNYYQCEYVSMLLNPEIPIVVGSSPFGCGKSMTIVTAALEIYKNLDAMKKKDKKKKRQLLVTQSNYASVNLVDISGKIYLEDQQEDDNKLKFVRFVSEKNWKELPLECLTDYDLPMLMEQVFFDWATVGCADEPEGLEERHKRDMVLFLTKEKKVDPAKFNSQALRFHSQTQQDDPWRSTLLEAFFLLYNPDIIMTTADSLQTLLSSRVLKPEDVYTIQIDEASQVPEYTFISLLTQFPKATYGLIGDIQQLPPYCETGLDGKLKDYGIGNTMERCVEEELFPQAMLREVYRCHPKITGLLNQQEDDNKLKFVRFVSEKNWKELPLECLTDYDLPMLMEQVFFDWATVGCADEPEGLGERHKRDMVLFLTKEKKVDPAKFNSQALRFHSQTQQDDPWRSTLLEAFFLLYNPDIIMTTADSLQTLLSSRVLKPEDVYTIQIDEASQVPEYTFISLLTQFPKATYGLIGDIQQLPPYCETGLDGKLKDYGIGNTMERCVEEELFPQAMLREVYRCHPKITGLLSDLFYKGKLISGVTEAMRSQFMEERRDFWPGSKYPVLLVNNNESGYKMGTSCGNNSEKIIVQKLLDFLCKPNNGYELEPTQIGVISFYSAQTSVLTEALRGRQVKCGTVDAFQGTERDVIVLCCTNEKISEFMQMSNRINVAMSRAKQVTIIVGNLNGLKKAKYWKEIVKKAQENGCVMEARSILNTSGPPAGRRQRNRRNNNENAAQKKINFNENVRNWTIEKTATVPLPVPPEPAVPKNDLTDLLKEMNLLKIAISNYKLQEQLQQQQS